MNIVSNLKKIKASIPNEVTLVAVSKTKPEADILEAYNAGQRIFGENKAQELATKHKKLPKDIEWHMIGHLQRNKVKVIAPFVSLIQGVDSLKLLKEINKRAEQNNRYIDCLLQVHIAKESTKFGFDTDEINSVIVTAEKLKNINIIGLMGMATFTKDENQVNNEFALLNELFKRIKTSSINTLSIGMSGDYKLAINNSSTMIRVGSAIFGYRN